MSQLLESYTALTKDRDIYGIKIMNPDYSNNSVKNYDEDVKIPIMKIIDNIDGEKILVRLRHNVSNISDPITDLQFMNGTIHCVTKEFIKKKLSFKRLFISNGIDYKVTESSYTVKCGNFSNYIHIGGIVNHVKNCLECTNNFKFISVDICDGCKSFYSASFEEQNNLSFIKKCKCDPGCGTQLRSYLPEEFPCGGTITSIFPFDKTRVYEYTFHADDIPW